MSYSPHTTLKTFVTFRVMGDALEPNEITGILKFNPTMAYRRGEEYEAGKRAGPLVGKTGVWFYSTDREVKSTDFYDHLNTLVAHLALENVSEVLDDDAAIMMKILTRRMFPWAAMPAPRFLRGRLQQFQSAIKAKNLAASVSCYWYGARGATAPEFPRRLADRLSEVPISIELDLDTESTAALSA